MDGSSVKMIDQTLLPHKFEILSLNSHAETARAIKDMNVRGAGAIGAAAGYAMAQAALEAPEKGFFEYVKKARETIEKTRPTARNLFYATERVFGAIQGLSPREAKTAAPTEAQAIADEDAENCRRIGIHGAALIKSGARVGTHCNAGWLAFVDFGSALSPIYEAIRQGKELFVYADETRPRGQGASLTSWELLNENIPHKIIPDNAAGFLMQKKEIDLMIVGADRICGGIRDSKGSTGDTANKIGTYEKAVCAKENGIPFYIAAPTTTIDFSLVSGDRIPIEERSDEEVLFVRGLAESGKIEKVRIAPKGSRGLTLAFDVTPGRRYITGFITERGIFRPEELHKLKEAVT